MDSARMPLYKDIFDTLKSRILSGEYPKGGFIPSEREMCEEFKVQRITLRRSLDMLIEEGLVEKQAGKGTLVLDSPNFQKHPQSPAKQTYILFILCTGDHGVDRFTEPFQAGLFFHIERKCSELGYHLIYKTATAEDHLSDIIKDSAISYVIFSSLVFEHLLTEAAKLQIPALVVNHQYPDFTSVQSNDFYAAQELVNYLIDTGHRRIAVLTGPQNFETSRERFAGWQGALQNHSIDYKLMPIYQGDFSFISGYETGTKILQLPKSERPDAVFAFNDESALGLMRALQENGVSVPHDISIAGFDDINTCLQVSPALTTVHVDIATMATAIIQQLYFTLQMSVESPVIQIRVPAYLIIRDSTAQKPSAAGRKEALVAAERTW